jgi:MFS family permease
LAKILTRQAKKTMAKGALLGTAAVIAGLAAAGLIVGAIEALGSLLHPELAEQMQDPGNLRAEEIPPDAVAIILVAWCAGAVAGAFVAALVTAKSLRRRSLIPAYGFGLLFVAACIANLWIIPHPTWMAFLGIVAPALLVMTTAKLTLRTFYRRREEPDGMKN